MATLMVTESADLERCESVIEKGMGTFVEVGQALARIRDGKLYRDTHRTFAAYVKERWNKSRDWADHTISSADAAARIENADHGRQKPTTERVARALSKAPKEEQAEVWAEVVEEHGEKVTAAKVEAAVERRKDMSPKAPPKAEKPVKNGKPVVSFAERKAARKALGDLIRALEKAGLFSELRQHTDAIAARLER